MDNQNSQTTTPINPEPVKTPELGHDKLMAGLYFVWDAFSRSQMDFFLVRQTARDVLQTKMLTGDHLDIGVRNNEWISGNSDLLELYFDQEHVNIVKQEPGFIDYEWQGIPFTLHLYEESPCVTSLVPVAYEYESWNVPNQFERFEKEFDK